MADLRKIRVLFIDDDGSIRIFAEAMFNNALFDIKVAGNTKEADRVLKTNPFDLIVCDIMMPGEDGLQYCNRLKKTGSKIPFVLLTAVGDPETVSKGAAAGALAHFIKPIDARDFQKKIISLVTPSVGEHKLPANPIDTKKHTNWWNR